MQMNNGNFKSRINTLFGLLNGLVSTIQTLWFIPYLKRYLGTSAYGYITVTNGLINTITVISFAIGSMSARYIVVSLDKENFDDANKYFNSDLFALLLFSGITLLIGIIISFHVTLIMHVSNPYISQVKILFLMTLLSFLMQLVETPFSASIYYTNSIYISYLFFIVDYLARIILTVVFFSNGLKVLWSASFGSDLVYFMALIFFILYQKRRIPQLKVDFSFLRLTYLREILGSGTWFAISSAGNTILSSISPYLSNLLCGAFITGVYSSIMQFSLVENVILGVLTNVAMPRMFNLFSNEKSQSLFKMVINVMLVVSVIISIITSGILIYGEPLLKFWIGSKFDKYNYMIIATTIYLPLTLPSQVINQFFSVANKVKVPAIGTIFFVLINILLAIILVSILHLYIYGIIAASVLTQLLRDVVFYPMYFKATSKYFDISIILPYLVSLASVLIFTILFVTIRSFFFTGSLFSLLTSIILSGLVSLIILIVINYTYTHRVRKNQSK